MPFVRFSRDKRGYEHVYLVEAPTERGKSSRARILYWYRTPPGIKVGRAPFDADTQRALEAQNPGIRFDWPRIVAAEMPPAVEAETWRERRRAERAARRARGAEPTQGQAPAEELDEGSEVQILESATEPDLGVTDSVGAAKPAAVAGSSSEGAGSGGRRRRRGGRRRRRAGKAQPNPPDNSSNEG